MDLIAGATGFIGTRLLRQLCQRERCTRALVRRNSGATNATLADLADANALTAACSGIETVFHCAGYAHAFSSLSNKDEKQHWQVNFEGTRNLVEAAGQAGVRRFVFLSSVKAMADPGKLCADEEFPGQPETAYGQSKRAAEGIVLDAGRQYGMHVVNLRLAMVYGSGGHGNLERMGRLISRGLFPPLPETGNHRSLVHVNDVVEVMYLVAEDDRANGRTYIISGPESPSSRQLYDTMREVLGFPHRRWSVPKTILQGAARCGDGLESLLKRRVPLDSEVVNRLLGSAWYSSNRIARELGWQAKIPLYEGLQEMFEC